MLPGRQLHEPKPLVGATASPIARAVLPRAPYVALAASYGGLTALNPAPAIKGSKVPQHYFII